MTPCSSEDSAAGHWRKRNNDQILGYSRNDRNYCGAGSLDPLDREVVALRHFEQITRSEAAAVFGITDEATAKRLSER
jgi:RNA polymerase sigma-70 factor, ECF subfamily